MLQTKEKTHKPNVHEVEIWNGDKYICTGLGDTIENARRTAWDGYAMIDQLKADNDVLLRVLFEELSSNGGHFASPDSHHWFDQRFADFGESTQDALQRLLKTNNGQ